MRIVGPILALLVSLSMAAVALTYMERQARQEWSYVQGRSRASSDHDSSSTSGYRSYANPDSGRTAAGDPDPYVQRYYSETEGWTYYTLPSYSSGR